MTESLYHSDNHEEAAKYASLGYKVFPLKPGDKKPDGKLVPNGVNDATTDLDQIAKWWKKKPDCGVGLSCEGLLVVDQDGATGKGWLSGDQDKQADLAESPVKAVTPSDGWHTVFQQPPSVDWRNTTSKLAPKVDTRANGGYICVYPTVLKPYSKDGKDYPGGQYRWLECQELDIRKETLPYPPAWLWEMVEGSTSKTHKSDLPPFDPTAPKKELTRDELRQSLESLPLWVNINNQKFAFECLIKAGWQFHSGPLRNGEIRLTRPGKNPRDGHSASWNHPAAYDRKWGTPRFRIHSVAEMEGWDAETSYSPFDIIQKLRPDVLDEEADIMSQVHYAEFGDEIEAEQTIPPPPPEPEVSTEKSHCDKVVDTPDGECPYWDIVKRCRADGFIRMFWDEMVRQEWVPQPAFRLAGALVTGAAMLGRKVATSCGETPAMVVVSIGPTGSGKNTAKSLVVHLLATDPEPPEGLDKNAAALRILNTQDLWGKYEGMPHSDSGLHSALHVNPALVNVIDELGTTMEAGAQNANGLQAGLLSAYTEIQTVGLGWISPRPRSDRKTNIPNIWAPVSIVLGFTQPEKVIHVINPRTIETGLTSRSLVFLANASARKRTDRGTGFGIRDANPELVKVVDAWRLWLPKNDGVKGYFAPWDFSPDAAELIAEIDRHYDDQRVAAVKNGGLQAYLYTRAAQLVKRLSLIFHMDSLGLPPDEPLSIITRRDVELAASAVDISMGYLLQQLGVMADSRVSQAGNKVIEFLKTRKESFPAGKDPGATRTDIRTALRLRILDEARGFDDVDAFIAGCENSPVWVSSKKYHGRVTYRYFHR